MLITAFESLCAPVPSVIISQLMATTNGLDRSRLASAWELTVGPVPEPVTLFFFLNAGTSGKKKYNRHQGEYKDWR